MKKIYIITLIISCIFSSGYAQNNILEARGMVGKEVTVKGIVTNGGELGPIRYFQDSTAGIAAYGGAVDSINRGDSVTISGTVKSYNQLLELDPITSVVVRSTGNPLPAPIVLTPDQISETYEARLVKVNNVVFSDAGKTFAGNKKYSYTANGQTGYVYIKNGQDFVGTTIPSASVSLTAICSQFDYSSPSKGYQLLPRDLNDIFIPSSIYFVGALTNTNFTHSALDFTWKTNIAGTTQLFHGAAADSVTANITSDTGANTNHSIELSGLNAGEITWVQAFSVSGTDTAKSAVIPFATISNSTGNMKVYFNTPVDVSYSTGVDATYLPETTDDTLIRYINRAKYTIDMAIYNLNNNGISNISNALKAAANRGVRVRVIGCGTTANLGFDALAGSAVHTLIGPKSYQRLGIMHNKFVVFDAQSNDPNDPIVWTGSTNLTDDQINLDANNVIIVQDQSLARTYQIEFEEMWGSHGDDPNAAKARFGSEKKDNTPHEFKIKGDRVECYFSPTDGVNAHIENHINTANHDLSIAVMVITRDSLANAIAERKTDGSVVNMLTNDKKNNATSVNTTLTAALGEDHYVFYGGNNGIMHNKYMIVDEGEPTSDPFVLTGSHNWSAAADNENDENTLIIHDSTIANLYYQNFAHLFLASNGILTGVQSFDKDPGSQLLIYPNPAHNGNVNLSCFLSSTDKKGVVQLIDITGKLVFNRTINLTNGQNTLKFNFPDLYKGTYILRLITNNKVWNKKILFE